MIPDFSIFKASDNNRKKKVRLTKSETWTSKATIENKMVHEAVIPNAMEYQPMIIPEEFPHKEYPFTLDTFQKYALTAIERDESVLVSAHTSAGKTVVAEYAIALCLANKQRCIYTSPIKALSNQKYRELSREFKDVGLITGDVTLNPNASILVMTTEILRNMLYKGNTQIREVHYIIFDEVHYIREKERGVVWEECIILAPEHIRFVFLSATIPNAVEFAEWISTIKGNVVHVIYTEKRPTPLEHYLAPNNCKKLYKILYEQTNKDDGKSHIFKTKENFGHLNNRKDGDDVKDTSPADFDELLNSVEFDKQPVKKKEFVQDGSLENKHTCFDRKAYENAMMNVVANKRAENSEIIGVINRVIEMNLLPCIVFSFSRSECERYAMALKLDFLTREKKEKISRWFDAAISSLKEEDRGLEMIQYLLPLLQRGIGIHHSGLLPILKEIVEILFQENLLKILFATETFSIGLNMPAKCVIFTNLMKFDGEERRILTSGEYIQMSGRAGRRGIDDKGVVIAMIKQNIERKQGHKLFHGDANKLTSAFRLSYNMILNLKRLEDIDPLYLMKRSFFHFQSNKDRQTLARKIERLTEIKNTLPVNPYENFLINEERFVDADFDFRLLFPKLLVEIKQFIGGKSDHEKLLQLSKVFKLLMKRRNTIQAKMGRDALVPHRVVDLCIPCEDFPVYINDAVVKSVTSTHASLTFRVNPDSGFVKKNLPLHYISTIYDLKTKLASSIKNVKEKEFMRIDYQHHAPEIAFLDACIECADRVIKPSSNRCYFCGSKSIKNDCIFSRCFDDKELENHFDKKLVDEKTTNSKSKDSDDDCVNFNCSSPASRIIRENFLREKYFKYVEKKKIEYSKLTDIFHLNEFQRMLMVLRRLEYCDSSNVLVKGRVACEISTGDELILTEMIFNGDFLKLPVEKVVPLLSCFVYPDWDYTVTISGENKDNYTLLEQTIERVADVMLDCGLNVDKATMAKKYSNEMMDIVERWVNGATFVDIVANGIFEGTIIRCFRRLEELLKQLCGAARSIGNTQLENLFALGIEKIKRDIIFANSLYI